MGGGVNRVISWLPWILARLRFNRTLGRHQGILHPSDADLELRRYHFESWWSQVAHPAFETNWTTIWKRSGAGADSGAA